MQIVTLLHSPVFLSQLKITIKIIVITIKTYNLCGYRKTHVNRNSQGGEIIAFLHNSVEYKLENRHTGVCETHETLFFNVKFPGTPPMVINFLCTYVPHRRFLPEFVNYLGKLPKGIFRKNMVIVGDLNCCPVRDENTHEFRTLENFTKTRNFTQLIQHPTYFSHQMNPSILDHVWSNIDVFSMSYVFKVPISDHIPSVTSFSIPTKHPKQTQIFRDFSLGNKNRFDREIKTCVEGLRSAMFYSNYLLCEKFNYLVL